MLGVFVERRPPRIEPRRTVMERQDASTETAAAPRMKSPDRSQVDPNPRRIDDLIPRDHPARVIWALAQELDPTPLYAQIKAVEGHAGRPPIDPRILVALWLYATEEGVAEARELHRRCYDCDPYKWLRGGVDVNYHTLADFRTQHPEWLKEQVVANIAAIRAEGLASLDVLGQDGMRVRAHAGNDSFRREATLQQLLEEAEQKWDRLQQEFAEETELSAREQAAQERAVRERIERLKQAQEEVQKVAKAREKRKKGDGDSARASTTDPEARRMKMGDGGTRPAYNVEFSTDLNGLVIMGFDVTNAGTDAGQMEPMAQKIEAEQGPLPENAEGYVDGGFVTREDLQSMAQRGVTVYAPVKAVEKHQQQGKDPYAPRRGDSPEVVAWRERMRTEEARQKYKQRAKCEWSNAECRNRGLQQFVVRGLAKVKTVVLWYVWVHNLFRMVALRAERALAAA
jgi:transposase